MKVHHRTSHAVLVYYVDLRLLHGISQERVPSVEGPETLSTLPSQFITIVFHYSSPLNLFLAHPAPPETICSKRSEAPSTSHSETGKLDLHMNSTPPPRARQQQQEQGKM